MDVSTFSRTLKDVRDRLLNASATTTHIRRLHRSRNPFRCKGCGSEEYSIRTCPLYFTNPITLPIPQTQMVTRTMTLPLHSNELSAGDFHATDPAGGVALLNNRDGPQNSHQGNERSMHEVSIGAHHDDAEDEDDSNSDGIIIMRDDLSRHQKKQESHQRAVVLLALHSSEDFVSSIDDLFDKAKADPKEVTIGDISMSLEKKYGVSLDKATKRIVKKRLQERFAQLDGLPNTIG